MENAAKCTENLIEQLKGTSSEMLSMFDKQLRSIRGSLKVEVEKKVELQQCIEQEKCKLTEIRDNPEYIYLYLYIYIYILYLMRLEQHPKRTDTI